MASRCSHSIPGFLPEGALGACHPSGCGFSPALQEAAGQLAVGAAGLLAEQRAAGPLAEQRAAGLLAEERTAGPLADL